MNAALVLGVGNSLLGDDGVGVHVARFLADNPPCVENCKVVDGGTLSFTLASEVEETDALIVIDAANFGEAPGYVRVFVGDEMDNFIANRRSRSDRHTAGPHWLGAQLVAGSASVRCSGSGEGG